MFTRIVIAFLVIAVLLFIVTVYHAYMIQRLYKKEEEN
jgi:hypothetical protein